MQATALPDARFEYEYLFAGSGCAGLSLLHHMIGAGLVEGKRILLVDADEKKANDRTWCFWEVGPGPFEAIVHRRWPLLDFYGPRFERALDIAPYEYKLIRGADFYRHCREAAARFPNIEFRQARIDSVFSSEEEGAGIRVGGETIRAQHVFSSLYEKPAPKPGTHWLLQHFKGRLIETAAPAFRPGRATLMDFRVNQAAGTSFVYVLPFSERQALVEYTLFTESLLAPAAYDAALDDYIGRFLELSGYTVLEEEFGVIPMTNHRFPQRQHHVVYLGTAGGRTKGSSGYTFRNIQKHSAAIVESLRRHGHPYAVPPPSRRHHFYDAVLLEILAKRSLEGADVFTDLFRKNDPRRVLRFLDNESSLAEELGIISTLPTLPFARAALRQLIHPAAAPG
ncbi:lycopene cyclase family protein [Flaviaesturariibacter aridisoli]|uniref:Lycopene cyclase n=1 Tax=Flaviaesturariibacter aridisoli TaxID=2545761 RepID=A0A4R4E179_9BACT|nr:lycopene cyclase family protein [Flaviaesturariibacter aridisoli]TCZ73146.1 lycopene cyclase [Flaviaesturariibacter aridisoli]